VLLVTQSCLLLANRRGLRKKLNAMVFARHDILQYGQVMSGPTWFWVKFAHETQGTITPYFNTGRPAEYLHAYLAEI
jgi:hypothetical protein